MSSRRFALAAGAVAARGDRHAGARAGRRRRRSGAGSRSLVFGVIIAITMYVTYVAAKRVKNVADFYAAGGGVSGLQNGWAIAGDYLSAASFLGIAGLISLYGYDGFMYSVGWLVAYITVLLVIAEPCRNIGKYTLSDILAYRNNPKATRIVGALSTITVSTFYLTAQMVGGGVLVKTLIGIDYEISVIGRRRADAGLRAVRRHGRDDLGADHQGGPAGDRVDPARDPGLDAVRLQPARLPARRWSATPKVQAQVAPLLGDAAKNMTPTELGQRFLEPGLLLQGADRPDLARHGAGVRHRRACRTS